MLKKTPYFILCFLIGSPLFAEKDPLVSLQFQVASIDRIKQQCYYQNDEKNIPIKLSNRFFSGLYPYRGLAKMNIFLSSFDDEDTAAGATVGTAQFPLGANGGVYLLLIDSSKNTAGGYSIKVWEKNQIFPQDMQLMVINRLNQPIRFLASSTILDIMPGQSVTKTPEPLSKDRFHARLYAIREGKPYKAYESFLGLGASKSLLTIARDDPRRPNRILLQTIYYRDYLHPVNLIKPSPAELKKYVDNTTIAEESDEVPYEVEVLESELEFSN